MQQLDYLTSSLRDLGNDYQPEVCQIYLLQSVRVLLQYERDSYEDRYETYQSPSEEERQTLLRKEEEVDAFIASGGELDTLIARMDKLGREALF